MKTQTEQQLLHKIISRIEEMSEDELERLSAFVTALESVPTPQPAKGARK